MKTVKFALVAASLLAASALSTAANAGGENLTQFNKQYFGGTVLSGMPETAPAADEGKGKCHSKHSCKGKMHHGKKHHGKKHAKKAAKAAKAAEAPKADVAPATEEKK